MGIENNGEGRIIGNLRDQGAPRNAAATDLNDLRAQKSKESDASAPQAREARMAELRATIARNEAELAARAEPRTGTRIDLVASRIQAAKQQLERLEAEGGSNG